MRPKTESPTPARPAFLAVVVEGALFTDNFTRATNDTSLAPWLVQNGNWSIANELFAGPVSSVTTDLCT